MMGYPCGRTRRASIFSSRRGISIGLVSYSSHPALMAFSRSPDMACAVSAMTGICAVILAALTRRVASQPSITGKLISIKIKSGCSLSAIVTACSPSTAMTTSNPLRRRRRESMSRFISLSSTNNIFAINSPLLIINDSRRRIGHAAQRTLTHRFPNRFGNIPIYRSTFSDDAASPTGEKGSLRRRQLLGGDNHHRYMTPVGTAVKRIHEFEPVHLWHHQVQQDDRRRRIFCEPG